MRNTEIMRQAVPAHLFGMLAREILQVPEVALPISPV